MRLWIDTDVGTNPDDAIALTVASVHPDVTLVGVSTVGRDDDARARVARDLIASAGGDVGIVVAGSALDPLAPRRAAADALLAIGPLTNVAHFVRAGASPANVAVMGGALAPVWHRGAWREVETNMGGDPAAAALVLAEVDVLLVPLDVTVGICLDDAQRARLAGYDVALSRALTRWHDAVCLHDPVALLALLREPFITAASRRLAVDASGRVDEPASGRVQRVVVAVDRDAAVARIFQLLDEARH